MARVYSAKLSTADHELRMWASHVHIDIAFQLLFLRSAQVEMGGTDVSRLTLFEGRSGAPTTALMKVLLPAAFGAQE